jgi:hypothetical protein
VIALRQRSDRLIHHAAAHADVIVFGAKRDASDLALLNADGEGAGSLPKLSRK